MRPDALAVDKELGDEIYGLVRELYPLCRSITGDGVRDTLRILGRDLPMVVTEVPSGTPVLDWVVPNEWNIRDAFIEDTSGNRIVDFKKSNLHVVGYSTPVNKWLSFEELRPHLHTIPERPDTIPYRTSYYQETWGFCMSHRQLEAMADTEYHVTIDATLEPGSLTLGEIVVPGSMADEVLISAHVCHPSLCDDNLSGVALAAVLARQLIAGPPPRHTVRFVFAPATIGAITWLALHRDDAHIIKHGLTLTCLGDDQPFTYKRSVQGNAVVDRAAAVSLPASGMDHEIIDFFPYGYDERQYGSPGFRLPVGSLMRARHGTFPEYHTSDDDLDFVSAPRLAESLALVRRIIDVIDHDRTMENLAPWGEPQLGRRGLYRAVGGTNIPELEFAMLWVLNQSDGQTSLLDIAERGRIDHSSLVAAARLLEEHDLVREVEET
jgi:aminopeptidase-like protein